VHPDRKGEGGQKRAAPNAAAENFGSVTEGSVVLRITMRDERWRRRSSLAKLVTLNVTVERRVLVAIPTLSVSRASGEQ
jgi:hypothetical protein